MSESACRWLQLPTYGLAHGTGLSATLYLPHHITGLTCRRKGYCFKYVHTKMSLTLKPGRRERVRDRLRTFLAPTPSAKSASIPSASPTRHSQDADTSKGTPSLYVPSLRQSSRTPSPRPEREQHRGSSSASVTGSSLPVRSASCVKIQGHVYKGHASSILADALEALGDCERKTIRAWLSPDTIVVDVALEEARSKARELQAQSAIKKWSWEYCGRQVYVQDQADKLVRFIDKFKSVGDAVANIDPVHIGLPWAGVRFVLEVFQPDAIAYWRV
jgi:hypothetical protein